MKPDNYLFYMIIVFLLVYCVCGRQDIQTNKHKEKDKTKTTTSATCCENYKNKIKKLI